MLNKSHFDWNDVQELQEIGLIALVYPEAVQRLFAHIPDANPDLLDVTSHLGRSKAP